MNLALAVQAARPHLTFEQDYRVVDYSDGRGAVLEWSLQETPPTEAELQDAWLPSFKEQRKREVRRDAFAEMDTRLAPGYEDRDLIFIILDAVNGTIDPRTPTLQEIRTRLAARLAEIDAATTAAEVQAVVWQ